MRVGNIGTTVGSESQTRRWCLFGLGVGPGGPFHASYTQGFSPVRIPPCRCGSRAIRTSRRCG